MAISKLTIEGQRHVLEYLGAILNAWRPRSASARSLSPDKGVLDVSGIDPVLVGGAVKLLLDGVEPDRISIPLAERKALEMRSQGLNPVDAFNDARLKGTFPQASVTTLSDLELEAYGEEGLGGLSTAGAAHPSVDAILEQGIRGKSPDPPLTGHPVELGDVTGPRGSDFAAPIACSYTVSGRSRRFVTLVAALRGCDEAAAVELMLEIGGKSLLSSDALKASLDKMFQGDEDA